MVGADSPMSLLREKMMRHCQAVYSYLETKSSVSVIVLDSALNILDGNRGFKALFGLAEIPIGRHVADFVALDGATPPFAEVLTLPFSKKTGFNGYLRCHFTPSEDGWLLFFDRLTLPESKVIERMAQLNSELLVIQRDMVQKNLLLDKLNSELGESRKLLQTQHVELQHAYHALQEETDARFKAVESSRESEQLLIQQNRIAAVGEMLSNLAHQWRQPLNILGLSIQELKYCYHHGELNQELLDGNAKKSMDVLKQMSETINEMMEISAPDREMRAFRVDLAVEKAAALFKATLHSQGISFDIGCSEVLTINGYQNEYIQVLLSILANARDALLDRNVAEPRITVRCWSEQGKSVVTITDNAGGIEKEIEQKIFDAYFTTKALGKGTGINLFLSKMIIEKRMMGTLTVHNTGTGAEFRIEV
jgi:C4-dicarboxylate-specific signal transduction histidine kinase